jgi:tetratricopeptide (TPR) repeat protein/O-antigen ligase
MSTSNIFIPSNQQAVEATKPSPLQPINNSLHSFLTTLAQILVVVTVAVTPLLFIAGTVNPTSFDRIIISSAVLGVAVIAAASTLLFKKQLTSVVPWALAPLGLFVLWGAISAYASGDVYDAVWGSAIEPLTVAFSVLLLAYVVAPLWLQSAPNMLSRALVGIGAVACVVLVHSVLRYWFGISVLDFNEFTSINQSLVGNFNDSAIYAGFVVLASLVSLLMLPLRAVAQAFVLLVLALALSLLVLVNFTAVWWVLLFASLTATVYVLLRRPMFQQSPLRPVSSITKLAAVLTLLVSGCAVLFGTTIATTLNQVTQTEFIEVRPSFESSVEILREIYSESPWLGIGPARFADAWRQHKSLEVNQTVFWDTDFIHAHSFVLSVFATYGLIGGLLLLLFQLKFLCFGITRLAANVSNNTFARYTTTVSFVGAVFLWAMCYVYTPSGTILLLAASMTGLTFAAGAALPGTRIVEFNVVTNRVRGFITLLLVVALIAVSASFWLAMLNKYTEQSALTGSLDSNNDEVVGLYADQRIDDLSRLISSATPDSVTQDDLLRASEAALVASRQAVSLDRTNPDHHERLASLYNLLGSIGVTGGYASAADTLREAIAVDPKNPKHQLALARAQLANDNPTVAKAALERATELKSDYTTAIQLQTELAIADGETEALLQQVENIVQLEPRNPARWYQLGMLYADQENTAEALRVLLRAVQLDPTYADARYLLALQYVADNRTQAALVQLRRIQETNPNNEQLLTLITSIENGEPIEFFRETPEFNDVVPVVDNESGVGVPSGVPTDFLAPVNEGG